MLGDIILWIFNFIKQQTCIHDYKWVYRRDNGADYQECKKCERLK